MIEAETVIAEAANLPLKDAAFLLWRRRPRLDTLDGPAMAREEIRIARALSPEEIHAKVQYKRDHAQDGPTFDRLKRAHPRADDTKAKLAIIGAVKFDDACFKYFTVDSTDYWQRWSARSRWRNGRKIPAISKALMTLPAITSPII